MRFLATVLLLAGITVCAQDAPKQDAPKKGGGGPPKNLKILKPEEVRPMMAAFRVALGAQGCNFCHVQGDNASDENPKKLVARKMIEMVNNINSQMPDGKVHVACWTCHRGKSEPEMTPPAAQ
jgi:photosynthetic reaction center cytochrome c subunit